MPNWAIGIKINDLMHQYIKPSVYSLSFNRDCSPVCHEWIPSRTGGRWNVTALLLLGLSAALDTIDKKVATRHAWQMVCIKNNVLRWVVSYLSDGCKLISIQGKRYKPGLFFIIYSVQLSIGAEPGLLVRWIMSGWLWIRKSLVRISTRPSVKNLLVLLDKALYLRLSWIMTTFCLSIMSMAMAP